MTLPDDVTHYLALLLLILSFGLQLFIFAVVGAWAFKCSRMEQKDGDP